MLIEWQTARSTLACGTADGAILLIEVKQMLHAEPASQLGHIYRPEVQNNVLQSIHAPDKKTTTGLQWVSLPARGVGLHLSIKLSAN